MRAFRRGANGGRENSMMPNQTDREGRGCVVRWGVAILSVAATLTLMPGSGLPEDRVIDTETGQIKVETVVEGLDHPWGLAFLPDKRMLVTERAGRLRIVSPEGKLSKPVKGVPKVWAKG